MTWGQYQVRVFRKVGGIGGRRQGLVTLDPADIRQVLAAMADLLPAGAEVKDYCVEVWSTGRRSTRVAKADG